MASSLDTYFGPRTTAAGTIAVRATGWPEAAENIRVTLDTFDRCQGGSPRSPEVRKARRAAARAWVEEYGENAVDLLERTYEKLKSRGMTVATERSLIKTAMTLKFSTTTTGNAYRMCPVCFTYNSPGHDDD